VVKVLVIDDQHKEVYTHKPYEAVAVVIFFDWGYQILPRDCEREDLVKRLQRKAKETEK